MANKEDEEVNTFLASELAERARTQASMYGFLATLYNQKPNIHLVRGLRSISTDSFFALANERDISSNARCGLVELAKFIDATAEQTEEEIERTLAKDWTRLFRGLRPGYGPVPPYEGLYLDKNNIGLDILKEINRWYLDSNMVVNPAYANRPDYLGLELDFLRHLAYREAQAWEQENKKEALEYFNKRCAFFAEHLMLWIGQFCEQALQHAKTSFYLGVLRLTRDVVMELSSVSNTDREVYT